MILYGWQGFVACAGPGRGVGIARPDAASLDLQWRLHCHARWPHCHCLQVCIIHLLDSETRIMYRTCKQTSCSSAMSDHLQNVLQHIAKQRVYRNLSVSSQTTYRHIFCYQAHVATSDRAVVILFPWCAVLQGQRMAQSPQPARITQRVYGVPMAPACKSSNTPAASGT